MDAFGKEYHSWMLAECQSGFKRNPMMVSLKKMFNGEIICHLKGRLKRLCYYKWKAWYTLLSSSGLKNICIFLSSTSQLLRGAPPLNIFIGPQVLCSNKIMIWKFIFPWRKAKWYVLQIAKALFSYSICLMISDKSIVLCYGVHVSSSCWCKHIPRVSGNKAYKTFVYKSFQFF